MEIRKVLNFRTIMGITIPKHYTKALDLQAGGYVEISLADNKTIVVKKHAVEVQKIRRLNQG